MMNPCDDEMSKEQSFDGMLSEIEKNDPALMMAFENAVKLDKNIVGLLTEDGIIYYLI